MGKTYYEKFGIKENASIGEIKSASKISFCYHLTETVAIKV